MSGQADFTTYWQPFPLLIFLLLIYLWFTGTARLTHLKEDGMLKGVREASLSLQQVGQMTTRAEAGPSCLKHGEMV